MVVHIKWTNLRIPEVSCWGELVCRNCFVSSDTPWSSSSSPDRTGGHCTVNLMPNPKHQHQAPALDQTQCPSSPSPSFVQAKLSGCGCGVVDGESGKKTGMGVSTNDGLNFATTHQSSGVVLAQPINCTHVHASHYQHGPDLGNVNGRNQATTTTTSIGLTNSKNGAY